MAEPGIEIGGAPEFIHFASRHDVVVWSPERVD
jgi:hypothetical protein